VTWESNRKIGFITIGCRANQADTARMESLFPPDNIVNPKNNESCEILVINTCAVTARAEADARKLIRRAKRINPDVEIIVTGCAVQVAPDKWTSMPEVTRVIGIKDRDNIHNLLNDAHFDEDLPIAPPSGGVLGPTPMSGHRSRPFLKIQDGCSRGCSYCIVPTARGSERSRPPELIADDIARLTKAGYREIVLTGVHLGRWGRDIGLRFSNLLDLLENTDKQARIRLSSLEPMDLTPDLLLRMIANPIICPHFHLPLQSGDQSILDAMKRGHRLEDYAKLLDCIKTNEPDASIGTDIMVGFPGETDETHNNTMDFLKNLPLTYLHIFKFSPRPGTIASEMPGRPYGPDVHRRMKELMSIDNAARRRFRSSQAGTTREFLIETPDSPDKLLTALSDNYLRIFLSNSGMLKRIGNLIQLSIDNI